ncbi:DUF362 domain-containing protein [Massilia antarctica]|uniref:DUF362 domain-containing protein n=1 Tax=Massilia antarctica TaxID=2765360 RepID=UPI0006BB8B77|nr:DUF362 domain-containing protein [Massilia sp. H27-R4]MCY0914197.1 DUF362 domain-containing protein [Massilia sp. H27-R4]CUI08601.1 hypothetical protein BN2497_11979 [Janthinobacterium sp. CG23_2]CUU32387.1 hypothetical protein BN3177_11979 [Janthinobacterium sp. CG23_2]
MANKRSVVPASAALVIVDDDGASPADLLRLALRQAGCVPAAPDSTKNSAVILLDLAAFAPDSPVVVRRELVEALLDLLAADGWTSLAIASSADSASTWLGNRDVAVLADLLGYRYETSSGTPYDIVDLSEQLADAPAAGQDPWAGRLSRAWTDADLRIVFAKCRTDQHDNVALCLTTLLCALPLADKDYHYRLRTDPWLALLPVLETSAPHIAIVDACGAAHGSGALQAPHALATHTIIAGNDVLAVDCASAIKMGADPASSPLIAGLIAHFGRPSLAGLDGSLAPFPGFLLPDPMLVEATRRRQRSPTLQRLTAPWLQQVDSALFPFKHALDAKCNQAIAPRLGNLDDDPSARTLLVYANWTLGAWAAAVEAARIGLAKDKLLRKDAPISAVTLACKDADFLAMERELDELRAWLATAPDPTKPLRWRRIEQAVLFEYQREFPVPLAEFAGRVDIARSIEYMNDYIGGELRVLTRDVQGRPLHQAERNVYLPQPNYVAWWGGKEIDVSKIESVHYGDDEQRMVWKTLHSENASALFDDGIITFSATDGGTRVSIFGRQLFALPPLLESLQLDRYPALKDHLTEHAYSTFFARTFSNFDALLEGREIAIGQAWQVPATPHDSAPRPVDTLANLATALGDVAATLFAGVLQPSAAPGKPRVDTDGFTHVDGPAAPAPPNALGAWVGGFWQGYGEAIARDLGQSAQALWPRT